MAKKKYEETESEFLYHEPCEACGSSDAKSVFSDGHTYCFSCEDWTPPTEEGAKEPEAPTKKPSKKGEKPRETSKKCYGLEIEKLNGDYEESEEDDE